jgi:hypothetical protein
MEIAQIPGGGKICQFIFSAGIFRAGADRKQGMSA